MRREIIAATLFTALAQGLAFAKLWVVAQIFGVGAGLMRWPSLRRSSRFYRDRGFRLQELVTRQGYGCNEFVFLEETD